MKTNTRKIALAGVLCAVAVVGSMFSFPVFGSKCAPVQHMVNVLCAVLLGPWYGVAVVLDPVGVGASHWRLEQIRGLLQCVHPDIVRVNYGEAAALLGLSAAEHGVDSLTVPTDAAACANALAERLGAVVLLSGEEDLVTDGRTLHTVRGGSPLMRRVTGAGCMLSVLCGAFAAVEPDALTAARHAAAFWKCCATAAAAQARGSASFRTALLDEASL